MASIEDVLDNTCFYSLSGCEQPPGRTTSMMLFNPAGSGVNVAVLRSFTWSSVGTEFNYKWRTTPHGMTTDAPNSMFLKPNGATTLAPKNLELPDLCLTTSRMC
jgi:hypothetical protein